MEIAIFHDVPKQITLNEIPSSLVIFGLHFEENLELIFNSTLLIIYKLIGKLKSSIRVWEVF